MTASYDAWAQMPKLVKYLPAEEAEEEAENTDIQNQDIQNQDVREE